LGSSFKEKGVKLFRWLFEGGSPGARGGNKFDQYGWPLKPRGKGWEPRVQGRESVLAKNQLAPKSAIS
jgi:hypothetical protein